MEGKRACDNICKCDAVDGGDYGGGYFCERNSDDYGCESSAGRRNVKFADVHDYGFQCNRYDDFANCDCGSAGEFYDRNSNGWRSISWHGDIYGEWIADWCERII